MYPILTSLVFVVLASSMPFMGNDPHTYRGTWYHSCAAPFVRQSGKTWRSLIFVGWFLVRLLFFHRMPPSCHSDITPGSRSVPLCVHDYRAFRTVHAALQTATAIVSSHELVSCGNGGLTLCCS